MTPSSSSLELVPKTLKAHVVQQLRDAIFSGRYKPGDRLNESQIAREFQISRIPVREALSQLEQNGLVMNHERRGMFVTLLSDEDVQMINSVRIPLEAEAMKLARARMTPETAAHLTGLVERMEAWDGTLFDAAALDLEFHRAIWQASGNPYLVSTLEALVAPLFAHKALEHVSFEIKRWRMNHHRELLELVQGVGNGDPQGALLTHLRMGYNEPERFSSLAVHAPVADKPSAKR
ncbi:MAG: GntR family transcriptional regulator [Caulobacter sp.]|jgi:DNA-binding GntR family transcriptional regulator|nr:GntR family transcriptional regulator [Caulobacter sp.]